MVSEVNHFRKQMQQVTTDFIPSIMSWITDQEQRMFDPFETEYSENYAPSNAAVILANVFHRHGDRQVLGYYNTMINRSVILLQDKGVYSFCRVFLFHYSLMSLLLLPKAERETYIETFGDFFAQYEDDCNQVNVNCAALQWGMEIFLDALGCRSSDTKHLDYLVTFIEKAQNEYGFINDEIDHEQINHDGMPIAYHAFILFILTSVLTVVETWSPELLSQRNRVQSILFKGMEWLNHTISLDGTFAMIERSSYQMFTWGAFVALYNYHGMNKEFSSKAFEQWLSYQHEDGSYSCTPNYLPHQLRTGFENYTHVNMYNNLGMTGIVIAEQILSRNLTSERYLPEVPGNDQFIDPLSGYAFVRRASNFFGCTLRMHNWRYAPAMQGFHYRLADSKLPLAEARFKGSNQTDQQFLQHGIWEGYLLGDEAGRMYFPDTTANVKIAFIEDGVEMEQENNDLHCVKSIKLLDNGIEWQYSITAKKDFISCEHVLPLLLFDGKQGTRIIEHSKNRIHIYYAGCHYSITCDRSDQISNALERSLISTSGVSTNMHFRMKGSLYASQSMKWTTQLNLLGGSKADV